MSLTRLPCLRALSYHNENKWRFQKPYRIAAIQWSLSIILKILPEAMAHHASIPNRTYTIISRWHNNGFPIQDFVSIEQLFAINNAYLFCCQCHWKSMMTRPFSEQSTFSGSLRCENHVFAIYNRISFSPLCVSKLCYFQ